VEGIGRKGKSIYKRQEQRREDKKKPCAHILFTKAKLKKRNKSFTKHFKGRNLKCP
jgi:hypothetical protein